MCECDCSICWYCKWVYVIDAYSIGCRWIDSGGTCPFKKERKEE